MCNWSVHQSFPEIFVFCSNFKLLSALSAGILVILLFLPGHPTYYVGTAAVVAKAYSNSMVAMLNSRVKPVSNTPAPTSPVWNESVKSVASSSTVVGIEGLVFRVNTTEISLESSRLSDITPLQNSLYEIY